MHWLRIALLIGFLAGPCLASASLSVSLEDAPLEGASLSTDQLFARIDSLTVEKRDASGSRYARISYRLGQLYLATGLMKHRRLALSHLEEALDQDPELFAAGSLRARTAQRMRYTRDASKWFAELTEGHPDDPRAHVELGRFHFAEAKGILDPKKFGRARSAYLAAVQVDSTHVAGWYGLAASMIALEEFAPALVAARKLLSFEETRAAGYLLAGAAHAGRGEYDDAARMFEEGIDRLDPAARLVFRRGDGFLEAEHLENEVLNGIDPVLLRDAMREQDPTYQTGDEVDVELALENDAVFDQAVETFWRLRNTYPTSLVNRRRLAFWKRLVEADVLFGNPDLDARGWDTEMGRAIVRWSRPDFMLYEPPSSSVDLEDWLHRGIRLSPSTDIPSQQQLWVWTYHRDGAWFSLLFTDPTYNSRWKAESVTVQAMIARSRAQPVLFYDGDSNARFELQLDTASFPRPDASRVECYVSIETFDDLGSRGPADEPVTLEWAIFDDANQRIDYRKSELAADDLRSSLSRSLGLAWREGDRDLFLSQLAAALPPGYFRVAVDVSSPSRGHRAAQISVRVPSPFPPGLLALSDLQLASSLVPFERSMDVPPEFVKYAYGVLPVPDAEYGVDQERLFVYFEAYNLTPDATGQTRFNVSYQVFRVQPGMDVPDQGQLIDRTRLTEMEPAGLTFVEERTGQAPEGHVVKGGEVDISSLTPGRYVLIVSLQDVLGEQSTSRFVSFRKRRYR